MPNRLGPRIAHMSVSKHSDARRVPDLKSTHSSTGILGVTGRDGYRRKALECVRVAEQLRDAGERNKLLRIAGLYMSLAQRIADRHERGIAHGHAPYQHHPEDA